MKNTKRVVELALLTAISAAILISVSFIPTGRVAGTALAGLAVLIAVVGHGPVSGILVYIAAFLLAVVISPAKSSAFVFLAVFGHYPVLKCLIEGLRNAVAEWILKILLCNAVFVFIYYFFTAFIGLDPSMLRDWMLALVCLAFNVVFVVYDIALTYIVRMYVQRIKNRR